MRIHAVAVSIQDEAYPVTAPVVYLISHPGILSKSGMQGIPANDSSLERHALQNSRLLASPPISERASELEGSHRITLSNTGPPATSSPGYHQPPMSQPDSPLSIAASITGILTFVAAVVAGFYAHAVSLKNAIDTQAEVASALEKIDFLETETNMLNNAYLASQIRHPERKYGSGDFKYFHGLYGQSLERMRTMDRELQKFATLITGGNRYDKVSRVKSAAAWMTARDRVHKAIEERKAESTRIFQIQLAILSA